MNKSSVKTRRSQARRISEDESSTHVYSIDEHDSSLVGSELRLSWGREHLQPIEFHGLDIGPFEMTLTVRDGESISDVYEKGMNVLDQIAERAYIRKRKRYIERIKEMSEYVKVKKNG